MPASSGDIEPGEFERPHFESIRLVENRIVERHFAVAIDMNVAKSDVARVRDMDRVGKRLITADHAIAEVVRNRDVMAAVDFQRQRERTLSPFLLSLNGEEFPVRNALKLDLVSNVMLARQLIDVARGRRIGDIKPGLSERIGRPDVGKRAAAGVESRISNCVALG